MSTKKKNEEDYEPGIIDDEENASYCDVCEHNGEYPDCLLRCPYDDD